MRRTARFGHRVPAIIAAGALICVGGTPAQAKSPGGSVRALPSAPRVSVAFTFAPARRSATLMRLARNHVSFRRTSAGRLMMVVGARRHEIVPARLGRRVRVRVTLDFPHNRLTAVARGKRVVVARRLVARDRLVLVAAPRGLSITAAGASPADRGATPGAPRPGVTTAPAGAPAPATTVPQSAQSRLFAAASVWNAPLAANAPLDPQSARLVGTLRATVSANLAARTGPWIQTTDSSTPLYRVPADQPMVSVTLDAGSWATTLQTALREVPIPANARPAAGSDGHMTIWQPSTDRMWELFKAEKRADGWHASFGGAMANVSASPGYYTADSWPGAGTFWGATATSLPAAAGMMRIDELQAGAISHALAIGIPFALPRVYAWPAQRTDGTSTDPNAIPEGARFRIDPAVNLDAMNLPPLTRTIAKAVQRYGMIVRDQTAHAVTFYAEDPTPTGTNPYAALYGGRYPIDLLASFPWAQLQLVKMDLRGG